MIHFPILRLGEPYRSREVNSMPHFVTGEPAAEVSQANGGLVARDLRKAEQARDALQEIPCAELIRMVQRAGELFQSADLPVGDALQSPEDFVRPETNAACRTNCRSHCFQR